MSNNNSSFSARMLAEAGVCIALAKILSFFTLFQMPQGGSVTAASMAPLFLFAIRWGWAKGMVVGAIYGLVDLMIGGYIVHPVQVILDYPAAYAMLGLAGMGNKSRDIRSFSNSILPILFATLMRLAMHILSGMIFYSAEIYAEGGNLWNAFVYSLTYNGSFLLVDMVICIVLLAIIWRPLSKLFRSQEPS